jgi:hypothetical protein
VLLAEYAQKRGVVIAPPISIEDIIEKHLKLRIEFDDTHRLFGVERDPQGDADILGAIFFEEARIVIDESLDPEENPAKEGRYRHWQVNKRSASACARVSHEANFLCTPPISA